MFKLFIYILFILIGILLIKFNNIDTFRISSQISLTKYIEDGIYLIDNNSLDAHISNIINNKSTLYNDPENHYLKMSIIKYRSDDNILLNDTVIDNSIKDSIIYIKNIFFNMIYNLDKEYYNTLNGKKIMFYISDYTYYNLDITTYYHIDNVDIGFDFLFGYSIKKPDIKRFNIISIPIDNNIDIINKKCNNFNRNLNTKFSKTRGINKDTVDDIIMKYKGEPFVYNNYDALLKDEIYIKDNKIGDSIISYDNYCNINNNIYGIGWDNYKIWHKASIDNNFCSVNIQDTCNSDDANCRRIYTLTFVSY